ncbi:AMP-binding protein [Sinomonas atrocyanea]
MRGIPRGGLRRRAGRRRARTAELPLRAPRARLRAARRVAVSGVRRTRLSGCGDGGRLPVRPRGRRHRAGGHGPGLVDRPAQPRGSEAPLPAVDPSSVATILYTSGTTGHPKGVLATHDATMRLLPMYGVEGGLQREDVMLVCMPLFHGGGLVIQALAALFFGATVVLFGRGFDPEKVLALVRAEKVSITLWPPTMLAMLAASGQPPSQGIRSIWYGSSSITPAVLAQARAMFPAAGFFQWYGTTEATSIAILRPEDHDAHPGATGREILTADVRIIDLDGNDVPVGGTGEVVLAATGTVMVGYFNNPAATEAAIRDGWMYTGDIAEVHEDGYFTIIGRGSDMIVTGGENVYPAEIEGVLAEHPLVQDAAVFGVADEVYGQRVAAAVVVTGHIEAEELQKYVGDRIARYKVPRELHVLDALPRNASGKVLRRHLVERFAPAASEGGQ